MRVRIVSLVPHATELLFALGAGPEVVGVTHECDYPPETLARMRVTRDVLPAGLSSGEIDAAVRERTLQGQSIYELNREALAELAPDLIVTQALCSVCAASYEDVAALAQELPTRPRVVSLDPKTLGETLADMRALGEATGHSERAACLAREAAERIDRVSTSVGSQPARLQARPRVLALEWLDPPYVAGHWTPQMIELAGGEDVLGRPGEPSYTTTWQQAAAAQPQVVIVMPCGFDAVRAQAEALAHARALAGLEAGKVVAVDASAYFSRPGPRLVEGLELLAHILHPRDVAGVPDGAQVLAVDVLAAAG
jgi:iron complex transport system substrate-binding protein